MKEKITQSQAESLLYKKLAEENIGDAVYEIAQSLFNKLINHIEENYDVVDNNNDSFVDSEEWYDDSREDFFHEVYDYINSWLIKC